MGSETEYYVQGNTLGQVALQTSLTKLGLKTVKDKYVNSTGVFDEWGNRIYPDVNGTEFATAEQLGPHEAAEAEFYGMAETNDLINTHNSLIGEEHPYPVLRRSGSYGSVDPNSKLIAKSINSRGSHQNHLIPALHGTKEKQAFGELINSYIITRIIWDGAGFVLPDGYRLSQKEDGIGGGMKTSGDMCITGMITNHGHKPISRLHEGHADDKLTDNDWNIFETRLVDSHMSLDMTERSFAMTSLVLRLFEHGERFLSPEDYDELVVKYPVPAMRAISKSPLGNAVFELQSGKMSTAASLQDHYNEKIHEMELDLPPDEQAALDKQTILCQKLGHLTLDELEPLVKDVEWITKLVSLRRKYGENSHAEFTDQTHGFDIMWHSIDQKSLGLKVFASLGDSWPKIFAQSSTPKPARTRGAIRGKLIATGDYDWADWNHVANESNTVELNDYWATEAA